MTRYRWIHYCSLIAILGIWMASTLYAQGDMNGPFTRLFDTGQLSSGNFGQDAFVKKSEWTQLPEDKIDHEFTGDAVFMNDKLAIRLPLKDTGVELYSNTSQGFKKRALFSPSLKDQSATLSCFKIVENTPNAVAVDAVFEAASGERLVLGLELNIGQVFVSTKPREHVTKLRVTAPSRFAVLPDFFADDIVIDAETIPVSKADLPAENFLLQMLDEGNSILMTVCNTREQDIGISVAEQGSNRVIREVEVQYGEGGEIWLGIIDGRGVWHQQNIETTDAGKVIPLDWRTPYPAQWRVDWRCADQLTDSWEMLVEQPNGGYTKFGWMGNPEAVGTDDWLRENSRRRWTTVLGWFWYPCWIDKDGKPYFQPLEKRMQFEGPAVVYPVNRIAATPLDRFTVVDIVRATLGVGPCEYILDLEGQQEDFKGIATCSARDILNEIYSMKRQKESREEINEALVNVLAFVKHIRGRIEEYVAFGNETLAYIDGQKNNRPELTEFLNEMETLTKGIDTSVDKRRRRIKTVEYAEQLVDEFRSTLVDYEGEDALEKCKRITGAFVDIGGNQDELVGECRVAVKRLRQQAGLATAMRPDVAEIAKEIRSRTQNILRNPASYEAPRH
ncbi:MAG: hypothetical protein ABIH23_27190 [bacterium]